MILRTVVPLLALGLPLALGQSPDRPASPTEHEPRLTLHLFDLEALRSHGHNPAPVCPGPFVSGPPIELTLSPLVHCPPAREHNTIAPAADVPVALDLPELRENPTAELLHELSFDLEKAHFGETLERAIPIGGDIERGQYLRDDDAIRSAIKIDKHFVATWVFQARVRFEAGYSLTYLSSDGGSGSYLRQGPWGGLSFDF